MVQGGWAKVSEARRDMGLDADEVDEVYLRSAAMLPTTGEAIEPPAPPAPAPPDQEEPEPIEGEGEQDQEEQEDAKARGLKALDLTALTGHQTPYLAELIKHFQDDSVALSDALSAELEADFQLLGVKAANVFMTVSQPYLRMRFNNGHIKAIDDIERLAGSITAELQLDGWREDVLKDRLYSHWLRSAKQVASTVGSYMRTEIDLSQYKLDEIALRGANRRFLADMKGPTRKALVKALQQAQKENLTPLETAARIRKLVPAGGYEDPTYRAEMIAYTETAAAQRIAQLEVYRDFSVDHVVGFDGTEDEDCRKRNGQIFSLDQAEKEADGEHPWGSLTFAPHLVQPKALGSVLHELKARIFHESDVNRDEVGRFASRPGFHVASQDERKELGLPPAWTDVQINDDESADLQVIAKDAKGRSQYRYSQAHMQRQALTKFKRTRSLQEDYGRIDNELVKSAMGGDDAALAVLLIARTGMRPGSETDTGADKQAFGASTLRVKHVARIGKDGTINLKFTGKGGKDLDLSVKDPQLALLLKDKIEDRDGDEQIFTSNVSAMRQRFQAEAPGFKLKDLRTRMGTATAAQEVASLTPPTSPKEFAQMRNAVGDKVSRVLGNTRAIALESYIDPTVFAKWEASIAKNKEPVNA